MTDSNRSLTRHLPTIGRVLLGLPLVIFGLMGLFHPMPTPPELPEAAKAFSKALQDSGYMMPLIAVTQVVCGALLVANRFVPLALAVLAPFFVNSMAFHICLEHSGLAPAAVFTALEIALAWAYRGAFVPMLRARTRPGA
jgi:uncharacterized membrane protein YphA (DoxX/SURF4 family)